MSFDVEKANEQAEAALGSGHIGKADILCRAILRRQPEHSGARKTLMRVATTIGLTEATKPHPGPRYILIKPWGAGFWADVNHALACFLVAELTSRIPIVHWGAGSRFSDDPSINSFKYFFEPPSAATIEDLTSSNFTYYPSKWNSSNLNKEATLQFSEPNSRMPAIALLSRPENVIVADFHSMLIDILPWIPQSHPLYSRSAIEIYRYLARRYLKPRIDIRDAVEKFRNQHFDKDPYLAIHLRGTDKIREAPILGKVNEQYFSLVDQELDKSKTALFLMTDSEEWLDRFKSRYGNQLVYTNCIRSSNATGVHFLDVSNRVDLGRQVLVDTFMAVGADRFIGNAFSAMSAAVVILKDWRPGRCKLFGQMAWLDPDTSLNGPHFLF